MLVAFSRGLRVVRNVRFFSIQDKPGFDQKLKQHYFGDSDEESAFKNEFAANSTPEGEESFLRMYKKQILTEVEEIEKAGLKRGIEKFSNQFNEYMNTTDQTEIQRRTKNLLESLRLKGQWDPSRLPSHDISDQYGQYESYLKTYSKMENTEVDSQDFGVERNPREIRNFKQKLGKEYEEADVDSSSLELRSYTKRKEEVEGEELSVKKLLQDGVTGPYDWSEKQEDTGLDSVSASYRLSPNARAQIYQMYLEGWTVRDLSIRFGILPERVKAVVWLNQHWTEEILPNADLKSIRMGIRMEIESIEHTSFVDYGLDLAEMEARERGVMFQSFGSSAIDVNPPKSVKEGMKQIRAYKGRKKVDIVTEKFVGRGTSGYYINNWIVYRGPGAHRVNDVFRRIIENSHRPQRLPYKAELRLRHGPREASKGYGQHSK
eukprot:TRINITY_DN8288_c0_g1_i3.p1 TRINITY_DN8288_c0_g1~~TRINITY_DN8288_c0_g1_i3.p1  ORF type:complete len:433 (+),score=96.28 TRINITY_DN8288_c0_g1_i3:55-1353(+)